MRTHLKKILLKLPLLFPYNTVYLREFYWRIYTKQWEKYHYSNVPKKLGNKGVIKNILLYSVNGLGHGGTEKNLQLIANALATDYKVLFLYGDKSLSETRVATLDSRITLIPFCFSENEVEVPHLLHEMKPHLKEVIADHKIDLLITASPGYSHYPWNIVTEIPIILLNIFGAPTLQKNIKAIIYNSKTTHNHASAWIGKHSKDHVMYAPLAATPPENVRELGLQLRSNLRISANDFIFGRIGRDDNNIFDPIGIKAWQKIADNNPNAHYLIMSPPQALIDIVNRENIPRVHFLPPSGKEEDVWAFHGALDAMAHFRKDGETSGVAIAESLTVGNPIITHRSHIWNAHLEYLTPEFSRVASIENIDEYANYMQEYINLQKLPAWKSCKEKARICGEKNFSAQNYKSYVLKLVKSI